MRETVSSAASRSLYTHIYVTSLSGTSTQPAAAAVRFGNMVRPCLATAWAAIQRPLLIEQVTGLVQRVWSIYYNATEYEL